MKKHTTLLLVIIGSLLIVAGLPAVVGAQSNVRIQTRSEVNATSSSKLQIERRTLPVTGDVPPVITRIQEKGQAQQRQQTAVITDGATTTKVQVREEYKEMMRRHEAAREQLIERKEVRAEALERIGEVRDTFKAARDEFRTKQTEEVKERALEQARTFLTRLLNSMLRHLEGLEGRVSSAENLNEGVKTQILGNIAAEKVWIQEALNRVPNLTTIEEIRTLTKEVKEKWRKAFLLTQRLSGRFLASRLEDFLDKLEGAYNRVGAKITAMKADGIDTATITELHGLMKNALDAAQKSLDRALTLFGSLGTSENAATTYRDAMSALREAHQQLREAHRILNEIIAEVKEIAGNIQNERASMQQGQKDDVDKEIEDEDQDDDNTTTTATTTNTVPTQ